MPSTTGWPTGVQLGPACIGYLRIIRTQTRQPAQYKRYAARSHRLQGEVKVGWMVVVVPELAGYAAAEGQEGCSVGREEKKKKKTTVPKKKKICATPP